MSLHAGVGKRLLAALMDFTLVVAVTWLLWLFPFQLIVNKAIDTNYKSNIREPYDKISEKYNGSSSFFGASAPGLIGELTEHYDSNNKQLILKDDSSTGFVAESAYNKFVQNDNSAYNAVIDALNDCLDTLSLEYNPNIANDQQFYSQLFLVSTYLTNAYNVENTFPHSETYEFYQEKSEQATAFQTTLKEKYTLVEQYILQGLNKFQELNPGFRMSGTRAYQLVNSNYNALTKKKASDLSSEFGETEVQYLKDCVESYRGFEEHVTAYSGDMTNITIGNPGYYAFVYGLQNLMFKDQLPYIEKYTLHTTWAIAYALAMFTLVYSVYTMAMRGYTLGRRVAKIKLVGNAEKDKLNPLFALLHDVPFKFLYVLALGLFLNITIVLIVFAVFCVVDIIMIAIKPHKCIRDYISFTHVVEVSSYQ